MARYRVVYIRTISKRAMALLRRTGGRLDRVGRFVLPIGKLRTIEKKLAGTVFIVEFPKAGSARPMNQARTTETAKRLSQSELRALKRRGGQPRAIERDKWAKYSSGWGPDSFHTVGD
jgi:hypothetical protein